MKEWEAEGERTQRENTERTQRENERTKVMKYVIVNTILFLQPALEQTVQNKMLTQ